MTSGGNVLPEPVPPAAQERVVQILTRHFTKDLLSEAELESRLERVYAATTSGELEAVIADLPPAPASESASVPPAPSPLHINALFSGQERKQGGVVPRQVQLRARLGYVELDLTRATFEPGLTIIDVRAFMGYVQIRFPPGVRVESEGRALFGFFALKGGGSAAGDAGAESVVRVTGRAMFGFAECFTRTGRHVPSSDPQNILPTGGAPRHRP
jgi:hypothetical protein